MNSLNRGFGVRKITENIIREGRVLILTEEDSTKYLWEDLPNGTMKVNPENGNMYVKVEGKKWWIPVIYKEDGQIMASEEVDAYEETVIIKETLNGRYSYIDAHGETHNRQLYNNMYQKIDLTEGEYKEIEVIVDDKISLTEKNNGIICEDSTSFLLTSILKEDSVLKIKYITPIPPKEKEVITIMHVGTEPPSEAKIGDLWYNTSVM